LTVIFGVFMAFMVTFVFISVYSQQTNARVDEAAKSLSEDLARTAFLSISSGQLTPYDLPASLAGSSYTVEVLDNSAFRLNVTAGRLVGSSYGSVVNATITVDGDLLPGNRIYFFWIEGRVIVSDKPENVAAENVLVVPSASPPQFYYFAKENAREAAGIVAVYFNIKEEIPDTVVSGIGYTWEDENLLVGAMVDSLQPCFKVHFTENLTPIGEVENASIVSIENAGEQFSLAHGVPSVENAYENGWLYSPDMVLEHLRSRSWRKTQDNAPVSIPSAVDINAAAVTTNVSTYPAWRITFDDQVIFYRAMPWWELENTPGFLFQSSPELYPII
jgi:hypothetical protein